MALAKAIAGSGLFNDIRDFNQALVKMVAGQEMGFGPIASMTGIHVIKGKITLSANLIAAAIRRSGHYDYRVKRLDDQRCEIEFLMNNNPIGVSIFTIEDARKAGLASGDNWKKYPRNMLFARAMSNGAKWYCPDVFGGPVYTPEELGAEMNVEEGDIIPAQSPPIFLLSAPKTISEEQREELERLAYRKGADPVKIVAHYKVETLLGLTTEQFADAVGNLNNRPDVSQNAAGTVPARHENNDLILKR
jgi:hypothetical protein